LLRRKDQSLTTNKKKHIWIRENQKIMDPADTIKNTTLKLIVLCCMVADPDPHYVGDPDSDLPYFGKPDPGPELKSNFSF